MRMFIDETKADDAEQIPIGEAAADAGCTVGQLLEAASGMQLKLHVAVRPFKYIVAEMGGSRPPNFPGGSSTSRRVELLPAYAAELSNFSNANVDRFPFPEIPGVPGRFFFVLDAPRPVTVDQVWIARGHVARVKDAATATIATYHRRTLLTIIATTEYPVQSDQHLVEAIRHVVQALAVLNAALCDRLDIVQCEHGHPARWMKPF